MDHSISTIGRYEIVRPLGEGGMGTVYLARDPKFNGRHVAIKLLRDGFGGDELRARFWREAQAAGQLQHPNIVTIFDWEEHAGRPFIAMEYVHGRTIAHLVEQAEPIPLTRRIEIIEGLCAGLACAHAHDILHRDIKPANVMVDEHGIVKILDFGIAKLTNSPLTQLTMQQEMLGTLSYMSPEQLEGAALDARSDVFAASAVAYELLTGHKAFSGSLPEVTRAIITGTVPPMSDRGVSLPPEVERAVLKGLAKRPEQRYADATAMQREFAGVRVRLTHHESPAVPVRFHWDDPTVVLEGRATAPPEPGRAVFSVPSPTVPVAPGVRGMFGAFDASVEGPQEPSAAPRSWILRAAVAAALVVAALSGWLLLSRDSASRTATTVPAARSTDAGAKATPTPPAVQALENRSPGRGETASRPPQGARATARAEKPADAGNAMRRQSTTATPTGPADVPAPGREAATAPSSSESAAPAPVTPRVTTSSPGGAPTVPAPGPAAAAPAPVPSGPPTLSRADEDAIRGVLRSFVSAFDNLSSAELKAVQPSLTAGDLVAFDRIFLENTAYRVEIVNPRIQLVSPTRARVDCSITRASTPKQGEPRQTTSRSVIVLDKTDTGWLISSVRGPG